MLGLFVSIGSLEPIENYDYFWHLASGRWIVEHRALPSTDPFTLASHEHPWINLEWLFQSILYPSWELFGHRGLTILLALLVGVGTAFLFLYALRRTNEGAALVLSVIAWLGASHRLDLRAETAAIPFLVAFLAILMRRPSARSILFVFLVTVVWFSVHPSALLAPVMAGLALLGSLPAREETRRETLYRVGQTTMAGLALLINPWGLSGVLAPVRLAGMLEREGLVNLEWLPSSPRLFPELYVVLVIALVLALRPSRLRWARMLLLLLFGALAVRYVRNHAFFYPALPILLAPSIPLLAPRWNRVLVILAAALVAVGFLRQDPGTGVDPDLFPVHTVEQLRGSALEGNVYTPDQLGGYLVWALYPERRTLVDGRNELYVEFFRRFAEARLDSRKWRDLFTDYDLTIAIEEYRSTDVEVIDGLTGEQTTVPASTVYYPREEWALIGFDEVSMLFARRDAHPPEIIARLELRSIVPDGRTPSTVARAGRERAWEELRVVEEAIGSFPRLERLRRLLMEGDPVRRSVDDAVAIE